MTTKEVFKHTAIYSFATILGRLISFVMLPFYAHIFQTEGYGVIGMIDASLGVLGILIAHGFHLATLRVYHQETGLQKRNVVGTGMAVAGALALLGALLPMVFAVPLSRLLLGSEAYALLLILALLTFVIDTVGISASTALIIGQRSVAFSAINLVRLVVGLTLNIWLVLVLDVGLVGVFIASLVATALAAGLMLRVALRDHRLVYDRQIARKLLRFQLPLLPADILCFLSRQADRFFVRYMIDIRAVGILEMAYKFPPLLNLLITIPFNQAWRTKSLEIAENDPNAAEILGKMFTKFLFAMVFGGVLLAITIGDLLEILTPREFWAAAEIARIDIVTTILASANASLAVGLLYKNKTGVLSVIRSSTGLVKIVLAAMLIYSLGLAGAAYAAVITEALAMLLILGRAQMYYRIHYEYRKIAFILVYGFTVYLLVSEVSLRQIFEFLPGADVIPGASDTLPGGQLGRWARLLIERRDNLIELTGGLLGSLLFLAAIPWLFDLRIPRRRFA